MKLKVNQASALLGLLLIATTVINCSEKAEKFGGSELHEAAMNNNAKKILRLLDSKVDVNSLDSHGRTALDVALFNNGYKSAETLIKNRADMTIVADQNGNSPLHVVSVNGNAAITSLLLKHAPKCLIDQPDEGGNTPLMMALANGNKALVEGLLQKKADVAKCNIQGDGPLHSAVICASTTDALQVYLEKAGLDSCELNRRNKNGLTPLDRAILKNNFAVARLYLDKGAVVNCMPNKTNSLHLAAANDLPDIERLFSPDLINSQDEDGFTPLHIASQSGQANVVAKLLSAGADSQLMNFSEETPLMSITHTECLPTSRVIAELLLDANAGSRLVINGQPDILETATFIVACQKGKLPLLRAFAAKRMLSPKILNKGAALAADLDNADCAAFLLHQRDLAAQELDQMPALVAIGDFLQDDSDDLPPLLARACQQGSAAGGSSR
jgi:ankyrin repeat protein